MIVFVLMALQLALGAAEAQTSAPGPVPPNWASAAANGAHLAVNAVEPRYCVKEGRTFCPAEVGAPRRACLLRNLERLSQPCRTALTLTPTTGGPGGFGRPLDAN
jgi:hypothetical protein